MLAMFMRRAETNGKTQETQKDEGKVRVWNNKGFRVELTEPLLLLYKVPVLQMLCC
jgi:hypothetical protein